MTVWCGDLESDGLKFECTQVWCIVNLDLETGIFHISIPPEWLRVLKNMHLTIGPSLPLPEEYVLYESHTDHLKVMSEVDALVYHNGRNFDYMALRKLYPWWDCKMMEDTFVMSSLFNPDRATPKGAKGPHSIDAWARRFGMEKPDHTDWTKFSLPMLYRCIEDVKIGVATWEFLQGKRKEWDWEQSLALEYGVAKYHAQQEMNGCPFNLKLAYELLERIDSEVIELESQIMPHIPPTCKMVEKVSVRKPFVMSGDYSISTYAWFCDDPATMGTVQGPFTRIQFNQINLNSHQQVKAYLLTQGWKPTTFNYKKDKNKRWVYENGKKVPTSPKLTEDSFGSITSGIGKLLARRAILKHRRGVISNEKDPENKGLISFIRTDGRISAEAAPQATNTGRSRHKKIVNMPKASPKVVYGKEMRSLFTSGDDPNYMMVGCDASQIEARMEAHYCFDFEGGKEYAFDIMDGDIHLKNSILFGTDRDGAKAPKYALTFGAQPPKLAETIGCSLAKGKELFNNFWDGNTALKGFRDHCVKQWKERGGKNGGYLVGLDGRKIRTRSEHSLVNCMFQSAAAIVFKTAACYLFNNWIPREGLDAKQIISMHDEFEAIVHKDHVDRYMELSVLSFVKAGEFWKLSVPTDGEAQKGYDWSQVH